MNITKPVAFTICLLVFATTCFFYPAYFVEQTKAWSVYDGPSDPSNYSDVFFTVAILPDTQVYAESYPAIFTNQTQWIVDHKSDWNIQFVTHVGDIVDDWNVGAQWSNANTSMMVLYNDGVPYGFCAGNHDYNHPADDILINNYQSMSHASLNGRSYWGNDTTDMGKETASNYQFLNIYGMNFIFMHIRWETYPGGDLDSLNWAKDVVDSHPNHRIWITTHDFIEPDGTWRPGDMPWNQELVDRIIDPNPNVFMVVNGHHPDNVNSTFDRVTEGWTGTGNVYCVLRNYQSTGPHVCGTFPSGGDGWLALATFYPNLDKIHIQTYSPYQDLSNMDYDGGYSGNITCQGYYYELWFDYAMEDIPQFISIDGGINGTTVYNSTPTFNWTKISGASQYNLQISNNSIFSDLVVNITDINEINYPSEYDDLVNVSFTLPDVYALSDYKTYYCRVGAYTS